MRPFLFASGEIQVGGLAVPLGIPSYGTFALLGMLLGGVVWARFGSRAYPEIAWRHLYLGSLVSALIGARAFQAVVLLPEIVAGRTSPVAPVLGGGVWLGGVIGGFLYFSLFLHRRGLPAGLVLNAVFAGAARPRRGSDWLSPRGLLSWSPL
jgi:hypothetical protein